MSSMPQKEPQTQALDLSAVVSDKRLVTIESAPEVVLVEAQRAAEALRDVITRKPHKVIMNGEQYLEFEDWQTVGRFYGITCGGFGDPEYVEIQTPKRVISGFRATSVALWRGQEVSRATAYCLNDEEKWSSRPKYEWHIERKDGKVLPEAEAGPQGEWLWVAHPTKPGKSLPKKHKVQVGDDDVPLYQLASMAQTRANAKVLRNVLSWVAVLAGYKPTPAEELDGMAEVQDVQPAPRREREPGEDDEVQTSVGPVKPGSGQRAEAAGAHQNPQHESGEAPASSPTTKTGERPPCPKCGTNRSVIRSKFKGPAFCCYKAKGGCGGVFNDAADFEQR